MFPRRSRILALSLLATVGLAAVACGGDDEDDATASGGTSGGLSVVASFYPLAELASRVGGDRVEVTNLTPAGVEPHDLELSPDEVDHLEDADLVLYLGEGFQPAVAEVAERRDGESVDLLERVELQPAGDGSDGDAAEEHGELDPHFWLNPQLMVDAVDSVTEALSTASPDDAEIFEANADEYTAELTALDDEMAAALADCERDELVTSHAAFSYLADRYGLTQLAITGVSPESEPDADRMDELADLIEEHGITTVFYETLVSPDVAETVAREAGVDTAALNPIEGLTEEQAEAGDDYASVMRANLAELVDALGCA